MEWMQKTVVKSASCEETCSFFAARVIRASIPRFSVDGTENIFENTKMSCHYMCYF